jgi:hypothetical protein
MATNETLSPAAMVRRLRSVVSVATRAPSIHNTQPWSVVATPNELILRADRERRLPVVDPTGRQLVISCGCLLFNLRVAAASAGFSPEVRRFPDPADPDLLARITVNVPDPESAVVLDGITALTPFIMQRHTNRRQFSREPVPTEVVRTLRRAAALEGAHLVEVTSQAERDALAELTKRADTAQITDPAYRAELRAWTTEDPMRLDGVPAAAVPHVDAGSGDEVPLRDFDTHGRGGLPTETRSTRDQCWLVLAAERDDRSDWLGAGEALERVLLEVTRAGLVASILSQIIEVPDTRTDLQARLGLGTYPDLVIRVGYARPVPGTQRRRIADVFIEE